MAEETSQTGGHDITSPGQSSGDPLPAPRDLKVKIKEQQLVVEWNDGKRSKYSLAELRAQCPCATCRTDREKAQKNPLQVLRADPTDVRVTTAKLVGNYAIQFFWSDGHNTGIFEFRYLRSLDV